MHLNWITIVADAAELLAGSLAFIFCCLGTLPGRAAQVPGHDLGRCYPELDRELDTVWRRYTR